MNPYGDAFAAYWNAGWRGILPLPYGKKAHPPTGYTGYDGADPSFADCTTWADDGPRNLALHLPPTVAALDVDHYDGKTGGDTLAAMVDRFGALPPTFLSTSRDDGISGIRLYRVPAGTTLPTQMPGIEFIQFFHRYVVAWPSVHPNGSVYRWIDERTGKPNDSAPTLDDFPYLPDAWLAGLAQESRHAEKADLATGDAALVLSQMPAGDPCDHMLRHAGKAMAGGDRHDSYNSAVLAVVGAGRRGCPGAMPTVKRLHDAFIAEIAGPKGRATTGEAEAEWQRGLIGALQIVANEDQGTVCPTDVLDWVQSLPDADTVVVDTETGEIEETPYDRAVRQRFVELRIGADAKLMLAQMQAGQAPPLEGIGLTAFLAQPDEEERYRVQGLWPSEGRVLLSAPAKAGKTTLVAANLIPALVDGTPFLGLHPAELKYGRVVYLNMEVGERTLRRWMRDSGIQNTERVIVVNLRGKAAALGLASEAGRARFAKWLIAITAEIVILDPLAPLLASLGLDENSNSDIALFFSWWSEALTAAGVADDMVVHHTGHAGQRSRGASRLLDEPDALWTLTRDDEEDEDDVYGAAPATRYLAAYGRDVELAAQSLTYDPMTRLLSLSGSPRSAAKGNRVEQAVRRIMADGQSRSRNAIKKAVKGNTDTKGDVIQRMIETRELLEAGRSLNGYPIYVLSDAAEAQR